MLLSFLFLSSLLLPLVTGLLFCSFVRTGASARCCLLHRHCRRLFYSSSSLLHATSKGKLPTATANQSSVASNLELWLNARTQSSRSCSELTDNFTTGGAEAPMAALLKFNSKTKPVTQVLVAFLIRLCSPPAYISMVRQSEFRYRYASMNYVINRHLTELRCELSDVHLGGQLHRCRHHCPCLNGCWSRHLNLCWHLTPNIQPMKEQQATRKCLGTSSIRFAAATVTVTVPKIALSHTSCSSQLCNNNKIKTYERDRSTVQIVHTPIYHAACTSVQVQ